ncbi:MAG: DUF1571 domain-containing protein [Candidatus Methylomirabilales bacterium]
MRVSGRLGVWGVWLVLWAVLPAGAATEADLLRLLERADARYAEVQDYTSRMRSIERVGDTLLPEEQILLKFQRPFRVYMRWLEGPSKGREGLYDAERHGGKFLLAEPRGLARLFTAALDPRDPRIMERSRHPVTDVGIGRLLEIVGQNARRAAREKVLRLVDRGAGEVAGRRVRQLEGILPRDQVAGYYGYRVVLAFDEEHHLPIRVVVYDWYDRLVEDYTHADLVLNPGLGRRDFDAGNSDYGFQGWRIRFPG